MMVEMDPSTLPTARRRIANPDRNVFSLSELLNRCLNGAGGDRTNYIFATSFAVLFCVIIIFANSNQVDSPTTPTTNQSHGSFVGTVNVKAPETHRQVQTRPTNVSILIVGDSIARYSYLSLVYFLRWGRWFDPGLEKSNLVNEASFDNPFHEHTYNEFYYQSNVMLQPYELCDCHKNAKKPDMRKYTYENRYYHDPEYNNTVTYIHAFGEELPTQGRIEATGLYTSGWEWSTKEKGLMNPSWSKPVWSYDSWHEFITEYVGKMNPKPEYSIFQGGLLRHSFGPEEETSADQLLIALTLQKIKAYWKTTNYNKTHMLPEEAEKLDNFMCKKLNRCLDISWTKSVKSELYWDSHHYFEPVYRVMNEDMLGTMGYLPEGYVKYNRTDLIDLDNTTESDGDD
jgi:hypothetical protein